MALAFVVVLVIAGFVFAQPMTRTIWYFWQLIDTPDVGTPSFYSGDEGKLVLVNSTGTELEFATATSTLDNLIDFAQITDTMTVDASTTIKMDNKTIILQASSSQTEDIFVIEKPDGTDVFVVEETGEISIIHTADHNDDRTLEVDTDAAGFGDVKAIDIDYISGAISAGEDEGIILINIDETLATGGDIFGLEVLATEGSAGIYGMKVGAVVGVIRQDSGVFATPTTGTDNTTSTDVPNMIDGDFGTTTAIFENDDEYIIIGAAAAFEEIEFIITTGSSGAGIKPTFAYSTAGAGTFTEFSPVDGTNGFRNTGVVAWDASDLTSHGVNTDTGTYDIKVIRTRNVLPTSPVLGYAKAAATTEYIWDKDGNVNIKSLTVPDAGYIGSASDPDAIQIEADGDVVLTQDLALSGLTAGSILFAGAGGVISEDNSGLFWDDVDKKFGVETDSPLVTWQVGSPTTNVKKDTRLYGGFRIYQGDDDTNPDIIFDIFNSGDAAVVGIKDNNADTIHFEANLGGVSWFTAGNFGLGEKFPETLTEWTHAQPYLTLHNPTHEDIDGGRESRLNFKGEQSGGEETTLARIEVNHLDALDDELGRMIFKVNTGGALLGVMTITGKAVSATTVDVGMASATIGNFDTFSATTGKFDTSLELPNGTDPDVDVAGEISADTDDNSLRGFGDSKQFLYAQMTKTIQFTIAQPDDLDEGDDVPVWSNESGFIFVITSVKSWADADNATYALMETSATNFAVEYTIASPTIATDGTGVYYDTTAVVTASGTIENGNMIIFDPSADDLEWIKVTILGYFDSDKN